MLPNEDEHGNATPARFICGVVEGFYGQPWTTDQRRKLFSRMKKMGLNTYLYAPKDDCKHRMYWREQYSVEEADHLTSLIQAAAEFDVDFVYAISPGIDIAYSSAKDSSLLKKKLEQVSSFGCHSFALLFDDIEVEMCESDKSVFLSLAQAQVSVTNEVYQHLNQPYFLFCPTEYCASRAVPSVANSEYLSTLGTKLLPDIDVMWTGPKVISKDITLQSINEITSVLKRPPVIWDNIHANDYDRKRLFLGPYSGRSTELIPHLHGVLTNPNCEFEANFIALHTLAKWSESKTNSVPCIIPDGPLAAEIALEQEVDSSIITEINYDSNYNPRQAVCHAISDWFDEILSDSRPALKKLNTVNTPAGSTPIIPVEDVPVVTTCSVPSILTSTPNLNITNLNQLNKVEFNDSYVQPAMSSIPLNSLVESSDSDDSDSSSELMDCTVTPGSTPVSSCSMPDTPPSHLDNIPIPVVCSKCDSLDVMQADTEGLSRCSSCSQMQTDLPPGSSSTQLSTADCPITNEDLTMLVDFFYLPFEHGSRGEQLLEDIIWLQSNSYVICDSLSSEPTAAQLEAARAWRDRADAVHTFIANYVTLTEHICAVPNQALVYDLFPYLWDMWVVLNVLKCHINWMALGNLPLVSVEALTQGRQYTWNNYWFKQAFSSGDHEPWVFRGGLQGEIQRILPMETLSDLLVPLVPSTPSPIMFSCRPYEQKDFTSVSSVCIKTYDDGDDGSLLLFGYEKLPCDRQIGALLSLSPEYSFVLEDNDHDICGYVTAVLNAQSFDKTLSQSWQPEMKKKYPLALCDTNISIHVKNEIKLIHENESFLPESFHSRFPSTIRMGFLQSAIIKEPGCVSRALACAMMALKSNGSIGVHITLPVKATKMVAMYQRLGFGSIPNLESVPDNMVVLGRPI